jgi:streptogramin lyase
VNGKVWFTEGGQRAYTGVNPNHSRVVQFDPATSTFQVYNVPGDNNAISGLTYANGRMWFASSAHEVENYIVNGQPQRNVAHIPAKLVSFDPNQVPFTDGTTFDYSQAPLGLVCASGANEASCYHEYPFADCSSWPFFCSSNSNPTRPGNLLADPAGDIWFTDFGGAVAPCAMSSNPGPFCPASGIAPGNNLIGRVHPTTVIGTPSIDQFPLPAPITGNLAVSQFRSGPWALARASDGHIIVSEFLDSTLARLDVTMIPSGSCTQLDANGNNPCIQELVIPEARYPGSSVGGGFQTVNLADEGVQGIALDASGNVWFAQTAPNLQNRVASLGFVKADWSGIVRLPPLNPFPGRGAYSGAGLAVGPSGEIWFADFYRQRVGRLRAG